MPGLPQWQPGPNGYQNNANAYIPVAARQSFHPSLPPPPTYVPVPLPSGIPPAQANTTTMTNSSSAKNSSLQPSSNPPRKKVVWSQDVRNYVQRSFAAENQIGGIQKPDIEAKLKNIITEATQSGRLDTVDWKQIPLPQQMILEERSANLHTVPPPPPTWLPPSDVPRAPETFVPGPLPRDNLRKRKSGELGSEPDDTRLATPWRSRTAPTSLEDRVSFAPASDKRLKLDHQPIGSSKFNANLENRKKRFDEIRSGSYSPQSATFSRGTSPPPSPPSGPIVGRSQKLEKNYFRLTSAPNPDDVRPLEVLRKTLDLLKKKWKSDQNYVYICDQFKSLRQDLTVQHIKNDFTTNVYEIHARIALEKGDLGEYNQCQTQLRALYKQKLGGHPVEFKAYRILYFIYTCNRTDMNDVLSDLTTADKQEPAIKHALDIRSALALGNYHRFFKLYLSVPAMGAYLMDMFVERERLAALASVCRT